MIVSVKDRQGHKEEESRSLASYVADHLGDVSSGLGKIERMDEANYRTRDAFGRLVEVLAEKGLLDLKEVKRIVCSDDDIKQV